MRERVQEADSFRLMMNACGTEHHTNATQSFGFRLTQAMNGGELTLNLLQQLAAQKMELIRAHLDHCKNKATISFHIQQQVLISSSYV